MFARLLPLILCASACHKNHDELQARLSYVDGQLARKQADAQRLNEVRRAALLEEEELERALGGAPEASADPSEALPPAPAVVPVLPPLPPESVFEGAEGQRLRRQIQDTEKRLAELARIIGELDQLEARRRQIQKRLGHLRERSTPADK